MESSSIFSLSVKVLGCLANAKGPAALCVDVGKLSALVGLPCCGLPISAREASKG